MSADKIKKLLEIRHRDDVFVTECNTGSTSGGYNRLDAWAMRKSWSKPLTIGFEIKVSRQDFLRDDKWPNYLPYCNEFYFVAPHGLIDPDEVPEGSGLLAASINYAKIFTKKKAAYREIKAENLNQIYKYILMSRLSQRSYNRESLENWVKEKQKNNLHHLVSNRVREIVRRTKIENEKLKRENSDLEFIKSWAERNHIDFNRCYCIDEQFEKLSDIVTPEVRRQIEALHRSIKNIMQEINQ